MGVKQRAAGSTLARAASRDAGCPKGAKDTGRERGPARLATASTPDQGLNASGR